MRKGARGPKEYSVKEFMGKSVNEGLVRSLHNTELS